MKPRLWLRSFNWWGKYGKSGMKGRRHTKDTVRKQVWQAKHRWCWGQNKQGEITRNIKWASAVPFNQMFHCLLGCLLSENATIRPSREWVQQSSEPCFHLSLKSLCVINVYLTSVAVSVDLCAWPWEIHCTFTVLPWCCSRRHKSIREVNVWDCLHGLTAQCGFPVTQRLWRTFTVTSDFWKILWLRKAAKHSMTQPMAESSINPLLL